MRLRPAAGSRAARWAAPRSRPARRPAPPSAARRSERRARPTRRQAPHGRAACADVKTGRALPVVTTMEHLVQDLRAAIRTLRHARGVSAVAIVTLALGIAAATTMFGVAYAALLRPAPFADADRLA